MAGAIVIDDFISSFEGQRVAYSYYLELHNTRQFKSGQLAENGVWYLRKRNVLFDPLRRQKTLKKSGFFGAVSFLFRSDGATGRT